MNVTESCQVNTLLRWLLGVQGRIVAPSRTDALKAAAYLADRANATLMAGVTGRDVERRFGRVEPLPMEADRHA